MGSRRGPRCACVGGLDRLFQVIGQGFFDDAPWVVLAGVEFTPVDIIDFRTHFLPELDTGAAGHPAQGTHQLPQLRGIVRKPLRTHDDDSKDSQQYEFVPVDSQHNENTTATITAESLNYPD